MVHLHHRANNATNTTVPQQNVVQQQIPQQQIPLQYNTTTTTTAAGYGYAPMPIVQQQQFQQQQIPIVVQQQTMYNQEVMNTTGITSQMSSASLSGVPHQTIVKPAIVQETVRTDTLIEVQPILHREIDQQRIHHVEQHITERAAPAMGGTVKLTPIVQETVHTNVVEEVQPVIHREIATRQVERVEEHISEHIAAPTIHTTGGSLGEREIHTTVAKPAIIDEKVRTDRLIEVQPIVHREIEQPRIHHVEKHITERAAPSMGGTVKLAPIVQESVHTNVIEEVQPVIHRERAVQHVERVQEHLTERVAAPVVHTTGAKLGEREIHTTVAKPAIIDEKVRTDRLVEVQPIVHREIEQPRVHHVEQHITERAAPSMGGTVKLAPIVQENVHTNVIEEVQPVIHRERAVQQVERVQEHVTEHVAAPAVHTTGLPLGQREIHSTVAKPAIVDERVRTDRLVEVQPIVHREIEQARVHHVEKHITEAPAPQMGGVVKMAPVVQQTVHTNVIEEVQPVIHRERAIQQVERVQEHITEHVVAPTQHTHEVQAGTTQGIALNQQGLGSNNKAAIDHNFQQALLDKEMALKDKAAVQQQHSAAFAAGGPTPASNLAKPL